MLTLFAHVVPPIPPPIIMKSYFSCDVFDILANRRIKIARKLFEKTD